MAASKLYLALINTADRVLPAVITKSAIYNHPAGSFYFSVFWYFFLSATWKIYLITLLERFSSTGLDLICIRTSEKL
jgi:hypothetical protein